MVRTFLRPNLRPIDRADDKMPTLPTCECIKGKPLNEIAAAIYCAFYTALTDPMNLPDCDCVKGQPLPDILAAIYCAVIQFTSQPFSGTINPDQINGITAFGEGVLLSNPDPNQALFFDGNNVLSFTWEQVGDNSEAFVNISSAQITDSSAFGREVMALNAAPFTLVGCNDLGNAVMADGVAAAFFMTGGISNGITAGVAPPTLISTINGITVSLS